MSAEAEIGVLGTVLGAIVGAILSYYYSKKSSEEVHAKIAKSEFTAAFTDVLVSLSTEKEIEPGYAINILKDNYPSHLAAYYKLMAALPKCERDALETKWNNYSGEKKYDNRQEREFYRFCHIISKVSAEEENTQAIRHINKLIRT